MTKRFSGYHMAAILVGFFGVVIAVNMTMATFATRTFGGKVVENSYVASQKFNGWLEAARRQEKLGWKIEPGLDGSRHVVVATNVQGEISGLARHPLGRQPDIALTFGKDGRSAQTLPGGRWTLHLTVRKGNDEAHVIETLS